MKRPTSTYLLAALAVCALFALTACAPIASTTRSIGGWLEDVSTKQPTKVKIKNATVWTQPRILSAAPFAGYAQTTAKLSEGVEVDMYCPPDVAPRCMAMVPGQQIRLIKGGYTEIRKQEYFDVSERESLTEEQYAEARLHGDIPTGTRVAVYVRKLKVRPSTYR